MSARKLLAKARRAAASAKLLLEAGDADGACNRAYYAMRDAARAALLASTAPVETEVARTHSGLISSFSLHLVKSGRVPVELEQAVWLVGQASAFVNAMQAEFLPGVPDPGKQGAKPGR